MKRPTLLALACATLLAMPSTAMSQGVGVAIHIGTLGIGADLAVKVHRSVAIRVGGNFFPADINIDAADISYSLDLPTQFTGVLDFYPGGGPFHFSGGVLLTDDLGLAGELTGTVDVGGTIYQAADVGNLTAIFAAKKVAPYFGIGIGDPAGSSFGFFLDLGVGLWGTPTISLSADGPITALTTFNADLAQEQADINTDLESLKVYPVLSIGFSIGFGAR